MIFTVAAKANTVLVLLVYSDNDSSDKMDNFDRALI